MRLGNENFPVFDASTKLDPLRADARYAALLSELKRDWKARLAAHEYPRLVEFVTALPMTATGKIMRRTLREREAARAKEGGKP